MRGIFKIDIGQNRVYGLDILRSAAILFVVFGHANYFLTYKMQNILAYLVFDGVSIFFVLSGFLIGGILIKEIERKQISFKVIINFWKRRWFRTLPNYLLVLTILALLALIAGDNFNLAVISRYYIFSQNLFYPNPDFFRESWSLSIEEWFYLLVPIIILIFSKLLRLSGKRALLLTAFVIMIAVTVFRYERYAAVTSLSGSDWDAVFRKQVFTRLDSLMFGVIGAYLAYYYNLIWSKYKILLFFTGIFLLLIEKFVAYHIANDNFHTLYWCVWSFSINGIGTLFLIPFLAGIKKGSGLIFTIITYISLISYSMYLINYTLVQLWMIDHINLGHINMYLNMGIKYFLFWFLTIALSVLIYKYFEVPTTKLRDKVSK